MPESDRPQHTWIPRILRCTSVIFFIMFIVQGIVGYVYINECPRQPSIPIFMFFCGFMPIFWALSWCFENGCRVLCYSLILSLCLIWFAGSMLIYFIYEPDYNKNTKTPNDYCNKTLYLFAFWCSNVTYILIVVHISCFISACYNDQMEVYAISVESRPLLWS